jgi:hypothetical protein
MPVKIVEEGTYELFETIHHHQILVLNGRHWFALVPGQQGDILVRTDSDHIKDHTIQLGRFYLVEFAQDPKFKDMPHLFLEVDGHYEEWLLPTGLPTEQDPQKRVVLTNDTLSKHELEHYLRHPAPPGPGEERLRRRDERH